MAVQVVELQDSRPQTYGENGSVELRFGIYGTSDDTEAHIAMLNSVPLSWAGLALQSSHIDPTDVFDYWTGNVRYGVREKRDAGDSQFSFDTGGGTQKITQAISQTAYGTNAPDFNEAIGVTKDSVEGVDVSVPVYRFSETHILPASVVTGAYKATLFALTGKKNGSNFRGFSPGEVLFEGASGSTRDPETWEVSFKFAASPNASNLSVGSISGITKRGWDYLWVLYDDQEDATANRLVKRPVAVYVAEVYKDGNFSGLGIGT